MRELKVRKRAELRLVVLAVTPATTSTATSSRRRRADGGLADWHALAAGGREGRRGLGLGHAGRGGGGEGRGTCVKSLGENLQPQLSHPPAARCTLSLPVPSRPDQSVLELQDADCAFLPVLNPARVPRCPFLSVFQVVCLPRPSRPRRAPRSPPRTTSRRRQHALVDPHRDPEHDVYAARRPS